MAVSVNVIMSGGKLEFVASDILSLSSIKTDAAVRYCHKVQDTLPSVMGELNPSFFSKQNKKKTCKICYSISPDSKPLRQNIEEIV